ncbi:unnamed protein product, partial [Ectocarpus sp. 13 AM-2016]
QKGLWQRNSPGEHIRRKSGQFLPHLLKRVAFVVPQAVYERPTLLTFHGPNYCCQAPSLTPHPRSCCSVELPGKVDDEQSVSSCCRGMPASPPLLATAESPGTKLVLQGTLWCAHSSYTDCGAIHKQARHALFFV